jgi:hypothetical protein
MPDPSLLRFEDIANLVIGPLEVQLRLAISRAWS